MTPHSSTKLELIFSRRSIRVYSPGAVSDDCLTQLLEAAMAAPSAMTKDPWRFVIVREPGRLSALASALPGGKMLPTAAATIVVCGDQQAALEQQLSFLLQDCSAATENLLLAAQALGLGACWVGIHPGLEPVRRVRELLALPAPVLPMAAVALGWPGERFEPRSRYNPAYVHRELWGNPSGSTK